MVRDHVTAIECVWRFVAETTEKQREDFYCRITGGNVRDCCP